MEKRKAQVFASDFIFSIALFLIVVVTVALLWNQIQSTIQKTQDRNVLAVVTYATSDALALSPGFPTNWERNSNPGAVVSSVGLASAPRVIDASKFVALELLPYDQARFLLGLGRYEFQLSVTNNGTLLRSGVTCAQRPVAYYAEDDVDFFYFLNGSGVVWDFYCVQGNHACDTLTGDWRYRYLYSNSQPGTLRLMLKNQSAYGALVIESFMASVSSQGDLVDGLAYFFNHSGVLFYEGDGSSGEHLLLYFNMNGTHSQGRVCNNNDGSVTFMGDLLRHPKVGVGSTVNFSSCDWVFESLNDALPLTVYVSETGRPSRGLVAAWNYSVGSIFYIADVDSRFSAVAEGVPPIPGTAVYNIFGRPLLYGKTLPSSAQDIFVSRRPIVLDLGTFTKPYCYGSMDLVVWRTW